MIHIYNFSIIKLHLIWVSFHLRFNSLESRAIVSSEPVHNPGHLSQLAARQMLLQQPLRPRVLPQLRPKVLGMLPHVQAAVHQHLAPLHHHQLLQLPRATHEPLCPQPVPDISEQFLGEWADLKTMESMILETFPRITVFLLDWLTPTRHDTAWADLRWVIEEGSKPLRSSPR